MRQYDSHLTRSQRGAANWAFILCLLALLAFVYLWFDEKDQREAAQLAAKEAEAASVDYKRGLDDLAQYTSSLADLVGYKADVASSVLTTEQAQAAVNAYQLVDLDQLKVQLNPDGVTADGSKGSLNYLRTEAEIQIRQDLRQASSDAVTQTPVDVTKWPAALREAATRAANTEMPKPPKPVSDPDDPEDVARYENELADYNEALIAFQKMVDELTGAEGFDQLDGMVLGPQRLDPDTAQIVKLEFFTQPPSGEVRVEELLTYPPTVINAMKDEYVKNMEAYAARVDQMTGEITSLRTTVDDTRSELAAEQQRHTADVQQLQGEVQAANERAERARQEATDNENRRQVAEENAQRREVELGATINAMENRLATDKEIRDLQVRRDDPDGSILTASGRQGTAIINLGSKDKAYPGLKFAVSRIGRGGLKVPVGEVMVIQVLDRSSSRVQILADVAGITRGDTISNPFYSPTESIHIHVVGSLGRYPAEITSRRLDKMNVVLDPAVTADTDYIIIPDSMAAQPETSSDDEDEMDEPTAGASSDLDRIQALARTFGAQVITERMLNQFLDY